MTLPTTQSTTVPNNSPTWIKGPALDAIAPNTIYPLEEGQLDIIIVNYKGEFTAFQNACLHQSLPIHAGSLEGEGLLLCPWHNWCYDVRDGACLTAPGAYLEQYPLRIEDGHVWISLSAPRV